MKTVSSSDRVAAELLETALSLSKHNLLSVQDLTQIKALCAHPPVYTASKVVQIRTRKAKMSQAVFAGFLNVTTSTVQKWESASSGKHPVGAAAKLLQLIERKGIAAVAVSD